VGDFGNHVMEEGRKRGWRLDNVFDLPRMLRFPGSMNFKVKGSPVEGSFLSTEGVSVTTEEIESKGIGRPVAMPAEAFVPPPDDGGWGEAERMCACRLVQMAMEDPSSVTEPLWHAWATNCAAVPGGRKLFHDISAMDGRYEEGQCDRKFAYALSAGKPCSCRYIATQLGFRCPEGGCGVRSPYLLCRLTGEERLDRLIASGLSPDNVFTEEVAAILFDVKVRNPMKYAFFKAKLREAGIDASDIDSIVSRQVPKNLPAVDDFTAASHSWLRTRSERAADHTPQEFFIDDYVVKGDSCSQIFGRTGNGKSFVVVDMMETIANPSVEEWHGHVVANHGKVLYLCGEGHGSIDDRMLVWEQRHGVFPSEDIMISDSGCDLDKVDGLMRIEEELAAREFIPDIIFVDTLNRFMSGNENDASEMRAFLNNCKVLQSRYRAAVYIITHTGKDPQKQDAARGSSALDAACDNIIKVAKNDNVITLSFTKVKRGKAPDDMRLILKDYVVEGVVDHHGNPVESAVCEVYDGTKVAGGAVLTRKQEEALEAFCEALEKSGEKVGDHILIGFDALREYLMDHFGWSGKRVSMEMSLTSKDAQTRYLGKLVLRDHL
ncbi:MAG: AAA family ATPase, partial [Spirochaetales bacterium]|nr:AAA family ATPase [Candidatus Physcosoma equi]